MTTKKALILLMAVSVLLVCVGLIVGGSADNKNWERDSSRERLSSEFVKSLVGDDIKQPLDEESEKIKGDLMWRRTWLSIDLETAKERYNVNPTEELASEIDRMEKEIYEIEQELTELGAVILTEEQVTAMFDEINQND